MKFYSHLIEIESIILELDHLDLSDKEKKHLASLIDDNLHQCILDAVLSHLTPEDKKTFINHLNAKDQEKIWEFLNNKVENIEEKIKVAAKDLKTKIHKDLKIAKRIS
ncbi:hypothetical protein HYS91_04485 [Candidatus Daviesbacteria bacterium]|nr:hypothetical protein [Candidatus Daviesbacteria bacterium]